MAEEQFDDEPQFNKPAFAVGHVLKNTIKWAAIGAVIGAAILLAAAATATVASGPIGWVAGLVANFFGWGGGVGTWASSLLTTGLQWGAVAGAVGGGAMALGNVTEAIDSEGERLQAKQDNYRMRRESNAVLAHQRELQAVEMERQAHHLGVGHNLGANVNQSNDIGRGVT